MISIGMAILGLLSVFYLWQRQRPAFIAGFIVLFGLTYRILDVLYLDLAGPIYAIELDRYVGGNGATAVFVLAVLCFVAPLGWLVSHRRILAGIESTIPNHAYLRGLQQLALLGSVAYIALLYLDLLRIGVIPLFIGMDRLEYEDIAGLLHGPSYQMNFLVSATFGIFTVLPRLQGGRYSISFVGLLFAFLFYWGLTGNRFSAFLVTLSYYAMPFAVVVAMNAKGILQRRQSREVWSSLVSARVLVPLGVVGAIGAATALVVNSYYEVRGYADPAFQIGQRVLVQPIQLWTTTWQSVQDGTIAGEVNRDALDYAIVDPVIETNTSILYLMEQQLGYFRALELITQGQQYAGGYPEIFFEIFGTWLAFPLMLLLGTVAAFLLYLFVRSVALGRALTAMMAIYLFFGFMVAYVGGMLNFLFVSTYWIKVTLLIIVAIMEKNLLTTKTSSAQHRTSPPRASGRLT